MKQFTFIILLLISFGSQGQTSGSITVGGDFDKFYPTVWKDGGWNNNVASQLEIGRSSVHANGDWRGSIIAKFSYHTYLYGNGAQFIDADIIQHHNVMTVQNQDFIGGWKDATGANGSFNIIIWLRGGGTTYYFKSLFAVTPVVYDGVSMPLPFQEENGPAHSFKTVVDPYVNSNGISKEGTAYFNGNTNSYFAGNVGIGAHDTKGYKLAVAGNVIAESIKVQPQGSWADYVFDEGYKPQSLQEIESFVKKNKHLPEIPSAAEVKSKGIDLGDMNTRLLKKIEELTLHLIEKDKELSKERLVNKNQEERLQKLESIMLNK